MLTYEWIAMITLGLERWDTRPRCLKPYEAERDAARRQHEARQKTAPAPPGLLQRLFSRQRAYHLPQPPRRAPLQKQASRV